MKTFYALLLGFASLLAAEVSQPRSLFDGQSLQHWTGNPQLWCVEGGAITGEIPAGQNLSRNEWIFWDGEVQDFDLRLEFRLTGGPKANSGIQYRCQQHPDGQQRDASANCPT